MCLVTLNIDSPLRIAILALSRDADVESFITIFKNTIIRRESIVDEFIPTSYREIIDHIYSLKERKRELNYNAVVLVTHGYDNGEPVVEGVVNGHPLSTWALMSRLLSGCLEDCLVLLAVCQAGRAQYVRIIETSTLSLHTLTPARDCDLEVEDGARAMATFANNINDTRSEHSPEMLQRVYADVNIRFPCMLEFWSYGNAGIETGDANWLLDLIDDLEKR